MFYARADDVVASVIDGRVVMEQRRLAAVDEAQIQRALRRHTASWVAGLRLLSFQTLQRLLAGTSYNFV